jgi:glucan biosynthesis protein
MAATFIIQRVIPFDRETGHARLLCQDVALDSVNDGLRRRLGAQLFRVVFVVYVVTDAHELAAIVGTRQKNDSNTQNVGVRDARRVRGIRFENKLVDSNRNGSDKERIEFLVVLVTERGVSELWLRYANTELTM